MAAASSISKKPRLTAVNMRIVLAIIVALAVVLIALGSMFAIGKLEDYATEVNTARAEADSMSQKVDRIQQLSAKLNADRSSYNLARQVVAESEKYQYQDTIIRDIESLATRAGLSIDSYEFDNPGAIGSAAANSATAAKSGVAAPTGLEKRQVTIRISGTDSHAKTLSFVRMIEQNLTKMQLENLELQGDKPAEGKQSLTINVYVKKG